MTDEASPHLKSLARLHDLIEKADLDWSVALDPEPLALSTGLPLSVVTMGLHGREMPVLDLHRQVHQRLEFLRSHRPRPDGKPYSQKEIGDGAGLTPQWSGQLLNGGKKPSLEHAARIEDFFGVPRGFLTATPSQALDRALGERVAELQDVHMAALQQANEKLQADRDRQEALLRRADGNRVRAVSFRGSSSRVKREVLEELLASIVDEEA
ncbi:helix-turn-helix domain-containing protein [Streptomyces sp. NPDC048331]|uniref:helix-turn-helix domain-containing protein n=1 Tax=Streptomyces sp. NPDC048331 TaxID=3365534 RepID=UPI0037108C7C